MSTKIRVKRMGSQLEVRIEKVVYHLDGGVAVSIHCTSFCGFSTDRHHVTNIVKVKVKVKVMVKFTLAQATKNHSAVEALLYSFLHLGARWGGWSTPRPGRFTPGKDLVPILEEAG
jgi:hypothetical protein